MAGLAERPTDRQTDRRTDGQTGRTPRSSRCRRLPAPGPGPRAPARRWGRGRQNLGRIPEREGLGSSWKKDFTPVCCFASSCTGREGGDVGAGKAPGWKLTSPSDKVYLFCRPPREALISLKFFSLSGDSLGWEHQGSRAGRAGGESQRYPAPLRFLTEQLCGKKKQ